MYRKTLTAFCVFSASASLGFAAQAQSYSYTAITVPDSTWIVARGINNSGMVVGFSSPNDSFSASGGTFANIDVSGAVRTRARGINDVGAVVGFYRAPGAGGAQAYVQSGGGLSTFSFAGANATQGTGINSAGSFVGGYLVGDVQHAFEYVGGKASEIVVPGSIYTFATGINNSGDVVGYFHNSSGNDQGFLLHNSVISTFSLPGAAVTEPLGINNNGQIVGDYIPTVGGNELPFSKVGNVYTLLNVPQSIYANPTVTDATGVNDAGVIVGYSGLSDGSAFNSYMATPIAGAALDVALAGGDASAPVSLPLTEIGSISGAIGGGVSSQFYSFTWGGGAFGASVSLTGADPTVTYAFELCSGGTCTSVLDMTKLNGTSPTGSLSDTLAAGVYTIGLVEKQPGTDPQFTLSFNSAVSGAAPEPSTWLLMILGVGGMGAALRTRRRKVAA